MEAPREKKSRKHDDSLSVNENTDARNALLKSTTVFQNPIRTIEEAILLFVVLNPWFIALVVLTAALYILQ